MSKQIGQFLGSLIVAFFLVLAIMGTAVVLVGFVVLIGKFFAFVFGVPILRQFVIAFAISVLVIGIILYIAARKMP